MAEVNPSVAELLAQYQTGEAVHIPNPQHLAMFEHAVTLELLPPPRLRKEVEEECLASWGMRGLLINTVRPDRFNGALNAITVQADPDPLGTFTEIAASNRTVSAERLAGNIFGFTVRAELSSTSKRDAGSLVRAVLIRRALAKQAVAMRQLWVRDVGPNTAVDRAAEITAASIQRARMTRRMPTSGSTGRSKAILPDGSERY